MCSSDLVNRVAPMAALMDAARELAEQVCRCTPLSLQGTKAAINAAEPFTVEDAYAHLRGGNVAAYDAVHASDDAKEGPRAFAEGRDIHASTASIVFGVDEAEVDRELRSRAKAINFGLLYGMGPNRLARETGMDILEARGFIERYFESFPAVRGWIDQTLEAARKNGYVETLMGRRRDIPDINAENQRFRAVAENVAVNTPIQGSAADVIKRAMIDLEARLAASDLQAQLLLQVHDELVLEVPENELDATRTLVAECMEGAVELDVPLKVDFGHGANWLEAH